ncbi:hypothetical protein [Desulfovibrio fairfieldensis]|uniref:Diaminopimelate epimerase n=1 Tax=Desulfovibrio fairfieldensis TaxID=44742 RepID=A0A0X8JKU4_9BACT|nr:hypothetical protein [Desulfovibrio fairfieldensis]AMD90615.1 hypothetical protein AXF13_11085 [Desulfovibrio fairfieldensis]
MPALTFSKWSPGGNTTLFFPAEGKSAPEQARLARLALDPQHLGGEQAGFVDPREQRLRMAGGEFCVNASRAFGALLAFCEHEHGARQAALEGLPETPRDGTAEQHYEIRVSGWQSPVRLAVRGSCPHWEVEAVLRLPACSMRSLAEGLTLVRLPGIVHVLLNAALHPFPEDCDTAAALLRRRCGLDGEAAVGAIWWRECQGQLDMLPLVHVRDAQTTCLESSCGSGALALALSLSRAGGRRDFSIMQPGGSALDVRLFNEGEERLAAVDGPVSLVARGQVWLPDDAA